MTETVEAKRQIGTINAAPSWISILPIYLEALADGKPQLVAEVKNDLFRMANLADCYVAASEAAADRLSLRDTFICEKGLWNEFATTVLAKAAA